MSSGRGCYNKKALEVPFSLEKNGRGGGGGGLLKINSVLFKSLIKIQTIQIINLGPT